MNALAESILAETEYLDMDPKEREAESPPLTEERVENTKKRIRRILSAGPMACIAFSGGNDSRVLLDLATSEISGAMPEIVWVDSQMEHPETRDYVKTTASNLGFRLHITKAGRTPREQWRQTGWPMLGKMAARRWMQKNKTAGFKINVSECCRNMKIVPGRKLAHHLGCGIQMTGQRGFSDDDVRGYRAKADGFVSYQQRDQIWIANPLTGWTDRDIKDYIKSRGIPEHPARKRGATAIGCIYCGGGSQFTNSEYRKLREYWPGAWWKFMVRWEGGSIILALKYKVTLNEISEAVLQAGGIKFLAETRPWIFDFTRKTPRKGYEK